MSKFGQQMKSGFGAVAAKAAANAGGLPRPGGMSILAAAVGVGAQRPVSNMDASVAVPGVLPSYPQTVRMGLF
jgi:hypothetical protein